MADIYLDTETPPATPASGSAVLYVDSVTKLAIVKNDAGLARTLGGSVHNVSVANQNINSGADTYITNSNIAIPPHLMQLGTVFRWRIVGTKTAAGVAAPVFNIRVGTAGAIGDTAQVIFTQVAAQTAAVDAGIWDITAVLRNIGAAGVLAGMLSMTHVLAITGFSTLGANVQQVTSAGFDTTVASTIVGVSVNFGATSNITVQAVTCEALNL